VDAPRKRAGVEAGRMTCPCGAPDPYPWRSCPACGTARQEPAEAPRRVYRLTPRQERENAAARALLARGAVTARQLAREIGAEPRRAAKVLARVGARFHESRWWG
jgi:hypothetical protein